MQEFAGTVGEITEGGGDFLAAGEAQDADGGVAEGGQVLGAVPAFDLALVLAEGHVADPVQAFDAPMPALAVLRAS